MSSVKTFIIAQPYSNLEVKYLKKIPPGRMKTTHTQNVINIKNE